MSGEAEHKADREAVLVPPDRSAEEVVAWLGS
jgi:hypothetical protein